MTLQLRMYQAGAAAVGRGTGLGCCCAAHQLPCARCPDSAAGCRFQRRWPAAAVAAAGVTHFVFWSLLSGRMTATSTSKDSRHVLTAACSRALRMITQQDKHIVQTTAADIRLQALHCNLNM